MEQNYPNPSTTISFSLPRASFVTLKIHNLLGEEVATLVHEQRAAGEQRVHWQPHDLPSGVYVYRLQVGAFVKSKKLVFLR
ncbi:MAG: T9SS type A sorting domain-containing protein [candidate division KSB1 bacterium]